MILYIRNLVPDDMRIPSPAVLALSGRADADFGALFSGGSQNRPSQCAFSGLGGCPNRSHFPSPGPEKVAALGSPHIPQMNDFCGC